MVMEMPTNNAIISIQLLVALNINHHSMKHNQCYILLRVEQMIVDVHLFMYGMEI